MNVQEHCRALPMAAGAAANLNGTHISGFLATVTGTLTVTDADGTVLVNAVPVTAGVYCKIPLWFNTSMGGVVQLTTAAGTLFI